MMSAILPLWARLGFVGLLGVIVFGLGVMYGDQRTGQKHIDYVHQQATASIRIMQARQIIVTKIETKYRDRIKTIFLNGEEIEKTVKDYISPAADARCIVNIGFVRIHDAAWTNTPPGATSDTDAESGGVSLAEIGEVTAHNGKVCQAWREQALGWRNFYTQLKILQLDGNVVTD